MSVTGNFYTIWGMQKGQDKVNAQEEKVKSLWPANSVVMINCIISLSEQPSSMRACIASSSLRPVALRFVSTFWNMLVISFVAFCFTLSALLGHHFMSTVFASIVVSQIMKRSRMRSNSFSSSAISRQAPARTVSWKTTWTEMSCR